MPKIFLIVIGAIILLWLVAMVIQSADKRRRDAQIRKRQDEKKEQEEKESGSPFIRS